MASTKLMQTKDGKRYFQICVSRGYGKSPYKTRWYWPDGWSKRTAERELAKVAAEFERACSAGEVHNRAELKEIEAAAAAERAKLKTFKSYALDVYMASKEQSFSENARSSYMMFFEKHLFPVFGDTLLVEISTAMINKFLLDFQKQGYKQATVTKLYNIMNGVFTMAFIQQNGGISPVIQNHHVHVIVNRCDHLFVVPRNCFYSYNRKTYTCYALPISPICVLSLAPEEYPDDYIGGDVCYLHVIEDADIIREFNCSALQYELSFNNAFVASARPHELQELKQYLENISTP